MLKTATALVLALALCLASAKPSSSELVELQPTNFEDTVNTSTDPWILYLYAPWCGHCKTFETEWPKIAAALKGKAKVAKIDPSDNAYRPKFHKLFQLVSFPHVVMLPAGITCLTKAPKFKEFTIPSTARGLRLRWRSGLWRD
jgi:thioredoxin-like negative regulator of GroEL